MTPSVRTLGWLAAACFVAAWFLPALADVPGWMAFRYAFAPVWPYAAPAPRAVEDAVPQVLSALTNVAFVVLLARLLTNRVTRPGLYLRVSVACLVLDLYWFVQMVREGTLRGLLPGYYAWLASFALLVLAGWRLLRASRPSA
jgi:hypothetical protein